MGHPHPAPGFVLAHPFHKRRGKDGAPHVYAWVGRQTQIPFGNDS
jgi:hypothetical protein